MVSVNNSINSNTESVMPSHTWYNPVHSNQFAGKSFHFANDIYPEMQYTSDTWIVDTGATDHITPFYHLLSDITSFHYVLHFPNGATTAITHIGSVTLSSDITLHNVLCVPLFTYNLLSVSKLLSDTQCNAKLHIVVQFRLLLG